MYTSLGKAAAAAGVSKSTILRAIVSHRISASKTDTGDWAIDPSELHRVFPPVRNGEDRAGERAPVRGATAPERHETTELRAQIENLRRISELLRAQLDDVRADRDAWRDQAQAAQRLLSFEKASGPPDRWPWWRRIVA
jgi:hypothetical protein